jgi:hypothetical protein
MANGIARRKFISAFGGSGRAWPLKAFAEQPAIRENALSASKIYLRGILLRVTDGRRATLQVRATRAGWVKY